MWKGRRPRAAASGGTPRAQRRTSRRALVGSDTSSLTAGRSGAAENASEAPARLASGRLQSVPVARKSAALLLLLSRRSPVVRLAGIGVFRSRLRVALEPCHRRHLAAGCPAERHPRCPPPLPGRLRESGRHRVARSGSGGGSHRPFPRRELRIPDDQDQATAVAADARRSRRHRPARGDRGVLLRQRAKRRRPLDHFRSDRRQLRHARRCEPFPRLLFDQAGRLGRGGIRPHAGPQTLCRTAVPCRQSRRRGGGRSRRRPRWCGSSSRRSCNTSRPPASTLPRSGFRRVCGTAFRRRSAWRPSATA